MPYIQNNSLQKKKEKEKMSPEAYYFQEEDWISFNFILYYFSFGYVILNHVANNPISQFIYNFNSYTS